MRGDWGWEGVGEQEVVPRGAIQAHSRIEHLFRVRAAPSGDPDCPAKAIVLTLPPSPSQASLNLKSDFFSFPSTHLPPFGFLHPGTRLEAWDERWGREDETHLRGEIDAQALTVRGRGPAWRSHSEGRGVPDWLVISLWTT